METVLHGDRRVDHYAWMRQKDNPEVIAYLEAENAYTDAILLPTESFQETLYQEMLGRILQTDLSVPYRLRGYLYFTCTEEGKQYPTHCRRVDAGESLEEMLLDLNRLAEGHSFLGLGAFDVSLKNLLECRIGNHEAVFVENFPCSRGAAVAAAASVSYAACSPLSSRNSVNVLLLAAAEPTVTPRINARRGAGF